jgi:hypothetical protein
MLPNLERRRAEVRGSRQVLAELHPVRGEILLKCQLRGALDYHQTFREPIIRASSNYPQRKFQLLLTSS